MLEVNDLGVGIDGEWKIVNGDLALVYNEDNLAQSILNRLQCIYDGLDYFYTDYGSFLVNFFGFKHSDETLQFIKIETEKTLKQDPRLNDFSVEVNYTNQGQVSIIINIFINEDTDFSMNLVIDEDNTINIIE